MNIIRISGNLRYDSMACFKEIVVYNKPKFEIKFSGIERISHYIEDDSLYQWIKLEDDFLEKKIHYYFGIKLTIRKSNCYHLKAYGDRHYLSVIVSIDNIDSEEIFFVLRYAAFVIMMDLINTGNTEGPTAQLTNAINYANIINQEWHNLSREKIEEVCRTVQIIKGISNYGIAVLYYQWKGMGVYPAKVMIPENTELYFKDLRNSGYILKESSLS